MDGCIVITGASRGIGQAVVNAALASGLAVCATTRDSQPQSSHATHALHWVRCDVRSEEDVCAVFEEATAHFGSVWGLVANAGIASQPASVADLDVSTARDLFDVHAIGTLLCAREFVRCYRRNSLKNGSVVLVSSIAARTGGVPGSVAYAASKAAVTAATLGLARELGPEGIRVNAVSPGATETDMLNIIVPEAQRDFAKKMVPLGRFGRPEEIAAAILWLLSDQASYVNGAILDITGGR